MEILGGSRHGGLTGMMQHFQEAPAAARLSDETCEVELSALRQLPAQCAHERGQVIEEVGEPEAQDLSLIHISEPTRPY